MLQKALCVYTFWVWYALICEFYHQIHTTSSPRQRRFVLAHKPSMSTQDSLGTCTPSQSFEFIQPLFSLPSVLLWLRHFKSYMNQYSRLGDEKDGAYLARQLYPFFSVIQQTLFGSFNVATREEQMKEDQVLRVVSELVSRNGTIQPPRMFRR